MKSIYDKYFFRRYLNDECSKQEKDEFLDWLDKSEEQSEISWMREIWEESSKNEKLVLGAEERILRNIFPRISNKPSLHKSNKPFAKLVYYPGGTIWQLYPLVRYASIILMILLPLLAYKSIIAEYPDTAESVQYGEKVTHNGQHLTFRLEDGTQVTLNSNSQLTYPVQFDDSSRLVTLKGEAFFDVEKDSKRPFKVVTGAVSTTALGTSFNIHYPEEGSISEVSLISGAVNVEMNHDSGKIRNIQLSPGEQFLYRFDGDSFEKKVFDPLAVTGWKDGIICFKEAGIEEIIERLEVWYDVEMELTGNVNEIRQTDWTYTGNFKNQNLENVLNGISYVKGFSFEINDKKIKLMFN